LKGVLQVIDVLLDIRETKSGDLGHKDEDRADRDHNRVARRKA